MHERPPLLTLCASGEYACFSRPEFSVERVSYPWITPSAARALFEAVLWKPRIHYQVRDIQVLLPIRYCGLRRNEIREKISSRGLDAAKRCLVDQGNNRQQRNTMALKDVRYLIRAELHLNPEVRPDGPDDNHGKYQAIFERRLARGQHFHQPYFGVREFAADLAPACGDEQPPAVDIDHGPMFYDFLFPTTPDKHRAWRKGGRAQPLYFNAVLRRGVVPVPPRDQVRAALPEALR